MIDFGKYPLHKSWQITKDEMKELEEAIEEDHKSLVGRNSDIESELDS